MHDIRFPGENDEYRAARNGLLDAERNLRRDVERVAALRRTLPPGGEPPEEYVFDGADGPVRLSELFDGGKDSVFVRRGGTVRHFYGTELLYAPAEPGQDGRHVDMFWPLWNLFDLTPEGRGTDWYPRLAY